MSKGPRAPAHLSTEARAFWRGVLDTFELEPHHVRLLTAAAEAWDRMTEARDRVAADGAYVSDRFGQLRPHPALAVEQDARTGFARLLRQLDLDVVPPGPVSRPAGR